MGATKLMTAGGGGVNIQPASSIASDVTVNVPSSNGTLVSTGSTAQVSQAMLASGVAGNGPAFAAYIGTTQSITSGVVTKIAFDTEEFDTNSCYDTVNYRFTPTVAGYYQININAFMATNAAGTGANLYIYKNGTSIVRHNLFYTSGSATLYGIPAVSSLVYLNGTTDYIEAYGSITATNPSFANTASVSKFSAALVRAA